MRNGGRDKEVVIEVKGLRKAFGDNVVLKDISFSLYKGESLVTLGRSGTGKSVLIKCMSRLISPDSGEITVLGEKVTQMGHDELNRLRRKIGFLFQGGALYDSMSVRENLEFPLKRNMKDLGQKEIDDLVHEALENVGLLDAADKMPSELSGGMRKRIALARTIILKPEIIFYDEPTTGLDTITSAEISHLILDMQRKYKTSSLIITHDMNCARITADRIMILEGGKFIAEGDYEELAAGSEEKVKAFFG
jgi:phospholipid/cholesterol/gamma-HCH transport system ATP-binding protein